MLLMIQTKKSEFCGESMRQNSKANILIRDSIADSKSWFDDFDKVKTKIVAPPEGRRIKIAVLDTGIDMGNSFFSNLQNQIKCWPSEADCKDSDGHGTHVAQLLLKIAPHADLELPKLPTPNCSCMIASTKLKL